MARKIDDFQCEVCQKVSELFIDLSKGDKPVCEHCGSEKMEKVLAVGTGNDKHLSWAKWRV